MDLQPLIGLSNEELEALAAGMLAPARHQRLNEWIDAQKAGRLSKENTALLDRVLNQIDQLNFLKARARYTLRQQSC